MYIKIRICFVLYIMIASILFFSCKQEENIIASDEIVINMGGEVQTIDPHLNTSSSASTYIHHMFEGLTKKDTNNKIGAGIAESYSISDDKLTYVFNIRDNAKWSDGKPITASDFVYSFKRVVDPNTGARYSTLMEPIKNARKILLGELQVEELGVKAIDDKTLQITLENPTPYFLEFIATTGTYMPVRQDIIEEYGDKWVLNPETYVVSGPYKMSSRNIDVDIVLEKNTNYWDKDNIKAGKITVVMLDDATTALAAVKNGNVHFSTVLPTADMEKLMDEDLIEINNAFGTSFWEINLTNEAFKDYRVRKALSLVIDRNYLIENITKSGQEPAGALVPPMIKGAKNDFREEIPYYISTKDSDYQNNVKEAKRLMAEAGYPNGEGYPPIEVFVTSGVRQLEAEAIQQMFKEHLNVDLMVSVQEWSYLLQSFRDLSYELISSGWTGDYNDPTTMLNLYLSYAPSNPGWINEEYDILLEEAKNTLDTKKRMELLHKAEKILMNEMPIIPTYYRSSPLLVSPKLKGYILDPLAKYRFNNSYIKN